MLNIAATLCQSAYRLCFVFTAVIQNVLGVFFVIFWTQLLFPAVGKKEHTVQFGAPSCAVTSKLKCTDEGSLKKQNFFITLTQTGIHIIRFQQWGPTLFLHPFMLLSLSMKSKVCMCVISSHHNFTSHIHSHVRFPSYLPVHTWSRTNFSLTFIWLEENKNGC